MPPKLIIRKPIVFATTRECGIATSYRIPYRTVLLLLFSILSRLGTVRYGTDTAYRRSLVLTYLYERIDFVLIFQTRILVVKLLRILLCILLIFNKNSIRLPKEKIIDV